MGYGELQARLARMDSLPSLTELAAQEAAVLADLGFEDSGPQEAGSSQRWIWRHEAAGTLVSLHFQPGDPATSLWSIQTQLEDESSIVTSNLGQGQPEAGAVVHFESLPRQPFARLWERHLGRVQARVEESGALPRPLGAFSRVDSETKSERVAPAPAASVRRLSLRSAWWIGLATLLIAALASAAAQYFGRQELARAQADARAAGLPGVAEVETALRKRLTAVAPTDDARADYGLAIANRGRGEAQSVGMVAPEAWEALQRGAARRFWPRERPPEGPQAAGRLRREGLDPPAIAEILGRRLEQVVVADDTAALEEVSQLARRIFEQLAASPRWDEAQALPEFTLAWCSGLERALVLRAEKNRPLSAAQAALLARDLPMREAFASRTVATFASAYAQLEDGWQRAQAPPPGRSEALEPLLRLLSPNAARAMTEDVRASVRLMTHLQKGNDPWGRALPKDPASASAGGAIAWSSHARRWADAAVRTDLARGGLAWHALWAQTGTPPGLVSELRAPWFQSPMPHPVTDRLWHLETRGPRDQRFVFEAAAAPLPSDESHAAWELTKLARMER